MEREIYRDIQNGMISFDVFTYCTKKTKDSTFKRFYDARLELMLQGQLIIIKREDLNSYLDINYGIPYNYKGSLICITYQCEKKPYDKEKRYKSTLLEPEWSESWIKIYNDYITEYLPKIYRQLLTS